MNNFGVLYRYECKKLLQKKILWISFAVCAVTILASLVIPFLGDYYIDGKRIDSNYNMYRTDMGYAQALSGRTIDQGLMEETVAAYRKIPQISGQHYTATEEYQQYARPYSAIFNFLRGFFGIPTSELMLSWEPEEEDLYARRQAYLSSLWEEQGLSQGEQEFWSGREEEIRKPYVYQVHEGYDVIFSSFQTVVIFLLMMIGICLSGMFSEEHMRKTDQIILSSPRGRRELYWAKMAAGISFSVVCTLVFFGFTFVTTICQYGAEGFHAAFQLMYSDSSEPITCGQAVLIAYGNMIMAAVVVSVIIMVLSELFGSNIAPLAVSVGLLVMVMIVSVPYQYRVLAQIWDWFPWRYLAPWNVFGQYTLPLFGRYLTSWQAVPLIYAVFGVLTAAIGKPIYQRFQVSGR